MIILYQGKAKELIDYAKKEANLSTVINTDAYPVRISFFSKGEQMDLFSYKDGEEEQSGGTPGLEFVFYDKIEIKTNDNFHISEEAFNKLKNLSKEVNRLFLNAFCQQVKEICEKFNTDDIPGVKPCDIEWKKKKFFTAVVDKRDYEGVIEQIQKRTTLPKYILED